MAATTPTVPLGSGPFMPVVGLGTAGLFGEPASPPSREALDAGYRHLDTATAYDNEAEVGRRPGDHGSRGQPGLDHVDLWLVHWPAGGAGAVSTWERFLAAREFGKALTPDARGTVRRRGFASGNRAGEAARWCV